MLLGWQAIDGVPHGLLTIVIVHGPSEAEEFRLQQCPKRFYLGLLNGSAPEVLMNQLLKMYLGE